MAYQPNIPSGTVPLNQDYLNLKGNFQSIDTQFLVDHVPLTDTSGTPPNGYHTQVHLVPFATNPVTPPPNYPVVAGVNGPTATVGYGQLFDVTVDDGINTDQALYYLSGGNRLTQLTRNIQPSMIASIGYTFLPGGLIMQWGTGSSGIPVVFNTAAPFATIFGIQVTPTSTAVPFSAAISALPPGNLSFTSAVSGGTAYNFYWTAIGI
ncbi:MAG: hypothetical protein WC089_03790 [Candidatus Paceibacterota bacterium]